MAGRAVEWAVTIVLHLWTDGPGSQAVERAVHRVAAITNEGSHREGRWEWCIYPGASRGATTREVGWDSQAQ